MAELTDALTPKAIVEKLAAKGISISERALRETARRTGHCRILGKSMFFMPEDVHNLLEAMRPETRLLRAVNRQTSRETAESPLEAARAKLKEIKERRRK